MEQQRNNYNRIHQRRFLLRKLPEELANSAARHVVEFYPQGTRFCLQKTFSGEESHYDLIHFIPVNIRENISYDIKPLSLSSAEYETLRSFPCLSIFHKRYLHYFDDHPVTIDVLEGYKAGEVIAAINFQSLNKAKSHKPSFKFIKEVTRDKSFLPLLQTGE